MFKNPNKFPFKDSVNISIHFQGIIVKNIDGNEMHSFFKKWFFFLILVSEASTLSNKLAGVLPLTASLTGSGSIFSDRK